MMIKIKNIFNFISKILNEVENDNISEYSAQCAYYTILSFIPFLILLMTTIKYTNVEQKVLLEVISKVVPSSMNEIVIEIVQEVYSKSFGTISISIIFTLWSAGNGLYALNNGINSIYNIKEKNKINYIYLRLKVIIETIIFIILIVMGLSLLVFGNSLIDIIKRYFGDVSNFNIINELLTKIGFIFVTFLVFLFVYKFMPKHKTKFKNQIYGAIFGALLLNAISFIFSKYLSIFKGFSITYGSLTTLVLIMMWTYACFFTVFLGAELNKVINLLAGKKVLLLKFDK